MRFRIVSNSNKVLADNLAEDEVLPFLFRDGTMVDGILQECHRGEGKLTYYKNLSIVKFMSVDYTPKNERGMQNAD